MKKIMQLTLPGDLDVDMLYDKGKLAYTFLYKGQTYGNATKLVSRKIEDIAATCFVLFTNALDTHKELEKSQ